MGTGNSARTAFREDNSLGLGRGITRKYMLNEFREGRPNFPTHLHPPITENLLMVDSHDLVFTILSRCVQVEAYWVKVTSISVANLDVALWQQQFS
jgi:hypothetical protein